MTDEERARRIVDKIPGLTKAQRADWVDALVSLSTAIRADQIEKCAKVADRHDTGDMQREDMEARRIAAAIRAMGDN